MPEFYTIDLEGGKPVFTERKLPPPDYATAQTFDPKSIPANVSIVLRMGSPDVMHCVIFRRTDKPGGIFALHDEDGFLFAAEAESNLAYAIAKGYFGELTANARDGVDIYENLEDGND